MGFERAGMECVWQVEFDKACQSVLKKHWSETELFDDVRTVGKHNLKPVDVICGGFPCQDLSVAGKRAGFDGERSSLWFEFERIIDEMQPKWVVIENVPGLLSSKQGRDFGFILNALDGRGYGVAWRVLDSQNFGVAQRRRRVFIVGSLGDASCAEVLFEPEGVPGDIEPSEKKRQTTSRTFTIRTGTQGSGGRGYLALDERAMTLGGQPQWVEPIVMSSGQANAEIATDQSPTLSLLHEAPIVNGVRRLTPTECERLQGFPDGWTDGQADSHRYKQMGNAVTVNVAEWIGKRIAEAHNGVAA